jgi:rhamnogalacturonyl hydrolase YesR
MKKTFLFFSMLVVCASVWAKNPKEFTGFPKGSEPEVIGQRLIQRYLIVSDNNFGTDRPLDYPKVCTWFGALRFADVTKDKKLLRQLEERFFPLLGSRKESMQTPNHVDNSVFGIVPLKLYMLTGNELYYHIGIDFADRQWTVPANPRPENVERYKTLSDRGLTWQTRFWIDDMYMITSVQSQAYAATKDAKYINRAAYEMTVYLDSIQRPNGLFHHERTAPFFWARGNGWMAAGMADLLKYLPENNPDRPRIMQEYRKMMETLKSYRNSEGIWNQLIDESDAWTETSGSAMYTYAMITGVKKGWLDEKEYAPVAREAWLSLLTYLNEDGNVREVCIGTNIGFTKEYYMQRPRPVGDLHGQAALLWCVDALLENE